ncbi:hypothetical protein [Oceanihabitans sediminis]|uniref:hypothetical protein n=1 Tax=Oceanihabitans sediminis TaxID=1812012 RepID=UPI00299E5EB1|nr:hypothetical protein [Oceanihabitans sediminis]MDX1774161.1 hypothetical protein [Oceanihabitans sediminis]
MNKFFKLFSTCLTLTFFVVGCSSDEIRNIAGENNTTPNTPAEVNPLDINANTLGFDFLEKMQGQWVGSNLVIADTFDWFSFDYRANSPSQIHGIYEGGSAGNLLTSFYVTDFKGKRTIMARNGGVLNGIYRTSYFVMDKAESRVDGDYYRLVDAKGSTDVMYMELRFPHATDSLYWNAYTSRLGVIVPPSRHMTFKGKKQNLDLAQAAATAVGFPQNTPAWDFSQGFNEDYLYVNPGDTEAKSATFLALADDNDVFTLAQESGDPWRIDETPHLGYLTININRPAALNNATLFVHLSKEPLTDQFGYYTSLEAFDSVLLFPELSQGENEFFVTYLHPGDYYVTVIADANGDGFISDGDITHPQQMVTVAPEQTDAQITITNLNVQN